MDTIGYVIGYVIGALIVIGIGLLILGVIFALFMWVLRLIVGSFRAIADGGSEDE